MADLTQGPQRVTLAARAPKTFRERLDQADLVSLDQPAQGSQGTATVIVDDRRRRPLYFDGRFLAARDLTGEQNYFLTRQADLGQAGGAGVIGGLLVTPGNTATSIHIDSGDGVTPSGEMVLIPAPLDVDLTNVPGIQQLDLAFGLAPIPNQPPRNLTGLFVVALRPVEFTANRIAQYPTSIQGQRTTHDGDIVEAAAITLIPYDDHGGTGEFNVRRARAARDIFLLSGGRGIPAEALPLAMIALSNGTVQWVDSYMVRREVGAGHGDVLGLGTVPRATREAYLLQYDRHLQDVLNQRAAGQRGWRFAASEHFAALPPAGRIPAASIDGTTFTHTYFPAQTDVQLSFVPDDEVRALIEESLLLPPIDLTLSGDALDSTAVVVLIPIPRFQMRALQAQIGALSRTLPAAAPNLLAKNKPLDTLRGLLLPRLATSGQTGPTTTDAEDPVSAAWREALGQSDLLWYMRRRNLSYRSDLAGAPVAVSVDETTNNQALLDRLGSLGLLDRYNALRSTATPSAAPVISRLLASPKVAASPALSEAAISSLERSPQIDSKTALQAAAPFADPGFGNGITRIEAVKPELKDSDVMKSLLDSGALQNLDKVGASVADETRLKAITDSVINLARSDDPDKEKKLAALGSVADVLNSQVALGSQVIKEAAVTQLENIDKTATADAETTKETFSDPQFGNGITRIEREHPDVADSEVVKTLVESGALKELDRLGAAERDKEALKTVTNQVVELARSNDPDKNTKIKALVTDRLKVLR